VKVSDTATYELSETTGEDNESTMLVWGITGTVVYLNFTYYKPSGAYDGMNNYSIDIYHGSDSYYFLVAANLTQDNGIYHGSSWMYINDTTWMVIAGINRTVSHFKSQDGTVEAWWDHATGLMVKANVWTMMFKWINFTMISTTAWSTPAPPQSAFNTTTIVAIAGVGALALIVGFMVGKHGKGKR
jgi:hypothetical protein